MQNEMTSKPRLPFSLEKFNAPSSLEAVLGLLWFAGDSIIKILFVVSL